MNKLQVFNNPEFGEIRTLEIDGKPYCVGSDVAKALGYARPNDAVTAHCRGTVKRRIADSSGRRQMMNCVSEGDLYRLIVHSQLPSAERFESWVFDEVLPSIRQTGKYEAQQPKQPKLGEINSAARIITKTLKDAGMPPEFRAIALQSLYAPAGVQIPLTGITMSERFYNPTEIAEKLGILSGNGKPHGQAVAALINTMEVSRDDKVLAPFQSNGHTGENVQYSENVMRMVRDWITQNHYPDKLTLPGKNYYVSYKS